MNETFLGANGERYQVRPACPEDRQTIAQWMASDPHHAGLDASYFYAPQPFVQCMVIEDEAGRMIFPFRITKILRLEIQFDYSAPQFNQRAMQDGLRWLERKASGAGFRQIIFESVSRPLINFCRRRLKFQTSPNELILNLPIPTPTKPAASPLHPVQSLANVTPGAC